MDIKQKLFALSERDAVGNIDEASLFARDMLNAVCKTERQNNLTVIGFLKGESDYTVMLDAHIDQIAMVVTDVDDNGFLTVSNAGGIDIRALPSRRVTVHGKEKITAVFCSVPPHLAKDEVEYSDIAKLKVDTLLGKKAKEIIAFGDFVTFNAKARELVGSRVAGRSFDDRAGVACVLEIAERLSERQLPVNVAFTLSDAEELGLRGAVTASFKVNPDEAIALDVSFGDGIDIKKEECGELGKGAMIGFAPVLDSEISKKLEAIAKQKGIAYQTEVMSAKTGTNADVISVSKQGVRTGLVSIPLRNMHSEVETVDIKDLESVCDLICEYILAGGVHSD